MHTLLFGSSYKRVKGRTHTGEKLFGSTHAYAVNGARADSELIFMNKHDIDSPHSPQAIFLPAPWTKRKRC